MCFESFNMFVTKLKIPYKIQTLSSKFKNIKSVVHIPGLIVCLLGVYGVDGCLLVFIGVYRYSFMHFSARPEACILPLSRTDPHCLCAVGAVTHVTHVEG